MSVRRQDNVPGKIVDYNLAVYGDSQPLPSTKSNKSNSSFAKSPHPYDDMPLSQKLDGKSLNVYIRLKRQENRCKSQLSKAISESSKSVRQLK